MVTHLHPGPIPTEDQTQTGPDSTSCIPLRLVITSEGKYDDNSEASDTAEDEATALDEALLEEDEPEDDDSY